MYNYLIVQLFFCTALYFEKLYKCAMHNCKNVQMYNSTTGQLYNCTSVQLYNFANVQMYKCTTVQLYNWNAVQ